MKRIVRFSDRYASRFFDKFDLNDSLATKIPLQMRLMSVTKRSFYFLLLRLTKKKEKGYLRRLQK